MEKELKEFLEAASRQIPTLSARLDAQQIVLVATLQILGMNAAGWARIEQAALFGAEAVIGMREAEWPADHLGEIRAEVERILTTVRAELARKAAPLGGGKKKT